MGKPWTMRWAEASLFLGGALLLGSTGLSRLESHRYQTAAGRSLDAAVEVNERSRSSDPGRTALEARVQAVPVGSVGRVEIPRLRMSAMIAEGTGERTLRRAVGHIRSTALPGEPGNIGLAGHRDTYFRRLGSVREDDLIRITTVDGAFRYRVTETAVVRPGRVDVLEPSETADLTLVTCYPFRAIGAAPLRFIVRAREVPADRNPSAAEARSRRARS